MWWLVGMISKGFFRLFCNVNLVVKVIVGVVFLFLGFSSKV